MTVQTRTEEANTAASGPVFRWTINLVKSRTAVLSVAALALVMYFHLESNGLFITSTNSSLLLRQTAVTAVVACGVALLIIMGEIDLSIGSAVFLAGLVAAKCQVAGLGLVPSVLAAVGVGVVLGFLQGIIITRLAVPAFVVTLAGLLVWRGVGLMWTNAEPIGPVTTSFINLTEARMSTVLAWALAVAIVASSIWSALTRRRRAQEGGVTLSLVSLVGAPIAAAVAAFALLWIGLTSSGLPNALFWISGVALLLGVLATRSTFGRQAFLVGSNREAALFAGINVQRTVLIGFLVMGVIYGIAGVMLSARLGASSADSGVNLELEAIAAAVIGGTSLRGGVGSIRGAILGAFLLSTIDNGMNLLGVSNYAENVIKGLILVFAVAVDGYFARKQTAT